MESVAFKTAPEVTGARHKTSGTAESLRSAARVGTSGSNRDAQPAARQSRIVILSPPSQPDAALSPRERAAKLELHQKRTTHTQSLEQVSRPSPFGETLDVAQSVDFRPSGGKEKASTRSHLSHAVPDEVELCRPSPNASTQKMANERVSAALQAAERKVSIKKAVVIVTSAPTSLPTLTAPLSFRRPSAAAPLKPTSNVTNSTRTMQQLSAALPATPRILPGSAAAALSRVASTKPHTTPDV